MNAKLLDLVHERTSGQLRTICDAHFASTGKALRPKLVYRLAKALEISTERFSLARNWAVALEILHNATLIHDDLQDGDRVRRDQATIWVRFGANQAINAGDFLLSQGPAAIDSGESDAFVERLKLHQIYAETAQRLVNGQSLEFEMSQNLSDVPWLEAAYARCVELKTATMFSRAALGIAVLQGMDEFEQKQLERLFNEIGVLFQVQDDVVDLFGDKQRGKTGCDLREGKVSRLVLNHLRLHPQESTDLLRLLRTERSEIEEEAVEFWIERFRSGGALDLALEQIDELRRDIQNFAQDLNRPLLTEFAVGLVTEVLAPIRQVTEARMLHA